MAIVTACVRIERPERPRRKDVTPAMSSKPAREWVLAEVSHAFLREHKPEVAVLPFGATEPHNLHMPYGTDNLEAEEIGTRACEGAYKSGAKVILLPTMPF